MAAKVFMQAVDEGLTVRSMLINSKVLLSELKMCLFSNPGLCSLQNRMNTELPKHVIYVCIPMKVANKEMLESLQHGGEKELKTYIYRKMWYPDYR